MKITAALAGRVYPAAAWRLLLVASLLALPHARGQEAQDSACASCHEQGEKVAKSAHARVACADCHPKHEEYPHPANIPKAPCASCHAEISRNFASSVHGEEMRKGNQAAPECSVCHGGAHEAARARTAEFRRSSLDTCGMCHTDELEHFNKSVHGAAAQRGMLQAPVCSNCHGAHTIQRPGIPASSVHAAHIRETCGECHGDLRLASRFGLPPDRLATFDDSFHGLASRSGSQRVANCASCHGYHDILPSTDRNSQIHPTNLGRTCGKCHPGAGSRFAITTIHLSEGETEPQPVRLARLFYLAVIPLTIGLMLLHHGGDWVRKFARLRMKPARGFTAAVPAAADGEVRMFPLERIQHFLLLTSFFLLVWTGFALKYPDQIWARPLLAWEEYFPVRGWLHRIAGAVMIGAGVLHVITLIVNRNLRRRWVMLFPRASDVREGTLKLLYNLGLRNENPAVSAHSYIEKAEYWAVVWGTAVMAATGIMLWSTNFMLVRVPKVWLDFATTVHFYEAVLATMSILVWHLYVVIFDPDVYPMDMAWLTGKSPRRREAAHHDVSPEREVAQAASEQKTSEITHDS